MGRMSEFIFASNKIGNSRELQSSLLNFLGEFGVSSFTMAEISTLSTSDKEKKFGLLVNYPEEWLTRYFDRHYADLDPVYMKAYTANKAFTWEEARRECASKKSLEVMEEAADFGLRFGVSFIIRQPRGEKIGFSFASSEKDMRCDVDAVSMFNLAAFQCYQVYARLSSRKSETNHRAAILSEREREVLRWVAAGKTKTEIADILVVSDSCVKRHCENIFLKLDTNTLAYAVAKAIRLGFIDF